MRRRKFPTPLRFPLCGKLHRAGNFLRFRAKRGFTRVRTENTGAESCGSAYDLLRQSQHLPRGGLHVGLGEEGGNHRHAIQPAAGKL